MVEPGAAVCVGVATGLVSRDRVGDLAVGVECYLKQK